MARPKKNAVEQPLELNGDKLSTENNNTQQSQENAAQQESNGQVKESEEDKFPLEVIDGVPLPIYNSNNSFVIYAPNDIEAHKGQLLVKTGITLKNGYSGLITPIIECSPRYPYGNRLSFTALWCNFYICQGRRRGKARALYQR